MKLVILLFFLFGAVLGQEGCSLSLNGNSKLVLDRFIYGFPKPILFEHGTLEAWIKPAKHANGTGVILQTGTIWNTIPQSYVLSYDYAHNALKLDIYSSKNEEWSLLSLVADVNVHPDVWSHVAVSIADTSSKMPQKLFINGKLASIKAVKKQSSNDTEVNQPCHRFSIGTNFTGSIDEVRVWSVVRTKDDIVSSMKHKVCGANTTDLVLYLSFDECEGNVTVDHSSSAACGRMRSPSHWDKYRNNANFSHHGHGGHHGFGMKSADGKNLAPFWLAGQNATGFGGRQHGGWKHKRHGNGDRRDHKFGDFKFASTALNFGSPAPAVGSCVASANASDQCPYATLRKQSNWPTPSGGDSWSDDSSVDFHGNSNNNVMHFFWVFGIIVGLVATINCCRRRRANKAAALTAYQQLPTEEMTPPEFAGYPGAYSVNMDAAAQFEAYAAQQEQQHQPFPQPMFVHPASMEGYDPRMAPSPYMYYMPQPVFYAPNLEHAAKDNQQ